MDDNLMEARRWVKAERGLKKLPDPDHSAVVARLAEMRQAETATGVIMVEDGLSPLIIWPETDEGYEIGDKINLGGGMVGTIGKAVPFMEPIVDHVHDVFEHVRMVDDNELAGKTKVLYRPERPKGYRNPYHIPQPMREGATMSRQVRRQLERLAGKPPRPVSLMQALGLRVYGEQKA